jgi:hypothetical protein
MSCAKLVAAVVKQGARERAGSRAAGMLAQSPSKRYKANIADAPSAVRQPAIQVNPPPTPPSGTAPPKCGIVQVNRSPVLKSVIVISVSTNRFTSMGLSAPFVSSRWSCQHQPFHLDGAVSQHQPFHLHKAVGLHYSCVVDDLFNTMTECVQAGVEADVSDWRLVIVLQALGGNGSPQGARVGPVCSGNPSYRPI